MNTICAHQNQSESGSRQPGWRLGLVLALVMALVVPALAVFAFAHSADSAAIACRDHAVVVQASAPADAQAGWPCHHLDMAGCLGCIAAAIPGMFAAEMPALPVTASFGATLTAQPEGRSPAPGYRPPNPAFSA